MTRHEDEINDSSRGIGRRTALYGAGGALAVGLAGCVGSDDDDSPDEEGDETTFDDDNDDYDGDDGPVKHRRDTLSEAMLADIDMDMRFTNYIQLDGDPTDGDRNPVHITSRGEETGDYACLGVDVQDHDYTLGKLKKKKLKFDFYGKKKPKRRELYKDDFFLIIKKGKRIYVVWRKMDVETGKWVTRNVSDKLKEGGWRAVKVDPKHVDKENERVHTTSEVVKGRIEDLRNADTFENLFDRFGKDATVLAVALGAGRFYGETINDHYFDNLRIGEKEFSLPAKVSLKAKHDADAKKHTVDLTFSNPSGEEKGLSLADVDDDSVYVAPYSTFAAPLPGTDEAKKAVPVNIVDKKDGKLTVKFDGDDVKYARKDRKTTVLLFGAFKGKKPYTFKAVIELE